MKKILLCLVLLLAACSNAPKLPPATETSAALPTFSQTPALVPTATAVPALDIAPDAVMGRAVTLWHALGGEAQVALESAIQRFNADNDWGLRVYPRAFGSLQALREAMTAVQEAQAGMPDLVLARPQDLAAWHEADLVLDLRPYWLDADWGVPLTDRAAFVPALLAQDQLPDGRLLGLPAQRSARGLFYNRSWAQALGFSASPRTADAFREQACAANQSFRLGDDDESNDGLGGWLVDDNPLTVLGWLAAFGGGTGDASPYDLTQSPNAAALTFLKQLYDDACAWLVDPQQVWPPYYEQLAQRQALMISGNTREAVLLQAYWQRVGATDEWTLIPFPGAEQPVYVLDGSSYGLVRSQPEQQLAGWLFLRWLMSPAEQARWAQQTGYLPARTDLPPEALSPVQRNVLNALTEGVATGVTQPQQVFWLRARAVLGDGFYIFFYQNWAADEAPALLDMMQTTLEDLDG